MGFAEGRFSLPDVNLKVALACCLIQMTVSTAYYFSSPLTPTYMRLVNSVRHPVFNSSQLPTRPLRALLGTLAASLAFTATLQALAVHFEIDSWQEGLGMAAALLVIDTCLNARHHFFEGRSLALFLLHLGYHAILLCSTCCILSVYGQPLGRGGGAGGSGHQAEAAAATAGGSPGGAEL